MTFCLTVMALMLGYYIGRREGYDDGYIDGAEAEREEMALRNMDAVLRKMKKVVGDEKEH